MTTAIDQLPAAAAVVFGLVTGTAIAFQVALAAGAPWGAYAMGGRFTGRLPSAMRVAAIGQAVVLAVIASLVLSDAGLVVPSILGAVPSATWLAVAFSGLSLVLNAASRSPGERRVWVPVAAIMLASSTIVALT